MNTAYLNGEYLPLSQAKVSAMDRGFLFGDGVYEVIPVYGGRLFRLHEHLQRLELSLNGIKLANPYSQDQWQRIIQGLLQHNDSQNTDASVYLQITRGVTEQRNHVFPAQVEPTVFLFTAMMHPVEPRLLNDGAKAITLNDIRWLYRNLKTTSLLANVLLRQQAAEQNADEAILIDNGYVTECSVSNVFMVKDGIITTPPKSHDLLPGITRDLVLQLAQQHGLACEERPVQQQALSRADEIWISSSTKEIIAVTQLNGSPIGDGSPGPQWRTMLEYFQQYKALLRAGKAE